MQYTMLIYHDEKRFKALSKEEQNRVHAACGAWHDALVKSGHSRGATGLQASANTTSLSRAEDGAIIVLDGPFTETKEMLGGFESLECRDRAEAIEIAKRFPALRVGAKIELRPLVLGSECRAD